MTRSTTPTPTVLWAAVALIALLAILPGCFFDVPEAPEAVAAEDCARFVGPFDDPNSLKLGAIFALSGPSPELGLRSLNALRLATDQINNFGGVGGLQNARPLAFQVCDDKGDPDQAVLVASYLADTLFPPAIVGPAQSRSVLPVADSVTIPSGIVQISGSATAVDISALDDDDLVWRTAPPDTDQPNALAYFAYWQLLRASATSGNNNTRVGLVNSNDAYGQGFASTFRTSLEATASVSSLVTIEFVSISYDASDAEAVQAAGEELVQESPLDAVLLVGFEETADILAFSTTEAGAVLRETAFFMPDGARSSRLRTLFSSESEKPALLFGVNPAFRSGDTFDQFATAYTEAFA
ncbi:MAG: ABC transporter substrate-binding protein, partial [Myxococcota bacterium]